MASEPTEKHLTAAAIVTGNAFIVHPDDTAAAALMDVATNWYAAGLAQGEAECERLREAQRETAAENYGLMLWLAEQTGISADAIRETAKSRARALLSKGANDGV